MQCQFINHALTPILSDVPVHMQCKMPLHVISCHMHNECYMNNCTHAYHQCIMDNYIYLHIISIHHFIHVNISCKHISTFTFNMSFYDQAMTHTQASRVMATSHNHSSHVNTLEHSLTSKQVTTLSSSGTLTIRPCHGHYTHQFITCQHVRAHTLTSKHVTLN